MNNPRPKRQTMTINEATISSMREMPHWAYDLRFFRGGYPQWEPVAVDSYSDTSVYP
jgi:hypothetical protein